MARLSGLSGSLRARFASYPDGPVRACVSARTPLELRGPFTADGLTSYYLRNTTAGVLADDAYRVDVTAAAGAAVRVAASSATKVYACRGGESSLTVSLTVEPGGLLVWGPHTTIVQTGAAYRQQTAVEVAAGGQAVLGEVLVMGRLARGERSGFKRIESRLDVTFEGAPVYSEAYCLSPGPDLIASMAGQGALASVYLLGSDDSTETRIDEALRHERLAGWSQLPNGAGLVVRGLCSSLSQAQCLVERILGVVRAGGAPGGVQEHV